MLEAKVSSVGLPAPALVLCPLGDSRNFTNWLFLRAKMQIYQNARQSDCPDPQIPEKCLVPLLGCFGEADTSAENVVLLSPLPPARSVLELL